MYRYLAVRAEAIKTPSNTRKGVLNTSECWPCIIESKHVLHSEQVIDQVYRQFFDEPRGYTGPTGRAFLVISLDLGVAEWVRFRPKEKEYNVEVVPYGHS